MLTISRSSRFKKDVKKLRHHQRLLTELEDVIVMLAQQQPLPERSQDHALVGGEYDGYRDCHVRPDLVLIYRMIEGQTLELYLLRVGSHRELNL